jgi:site-specific DNA recombinase
MFEKQGPPEKRRLLNFVLSNSTWKDGELTPEFRQPFNMLFVANQSSMGLNSTSAGPAARSENWLPGMDSNHDSRLQRPLSYH